MGQSSAAGGQSVRPQIDALMMAATQADRRRDARTAIRLSGQILAVEPSFLPAKILSAVDHLKAGYSNAAERKFLEILAVAPECFPALLWLGTLLAHAGRPSEAIVYALKAVQLRPSDKDPRMLLARMLVEEGRLDEALRELQLVLQIKEDVGEAHEIMAKLLRQLGRNDEAGRHVARARELASSGENASAQSLAEVNPDSCSLLDLLSQARLEFGGGRFDRAAQLCLLALGKDPKEREALLIYGIATAKMKRADVSVVALRDVLSQTPDEFDALIWLGIMLHQQGQFDEARNQFLHARQLEPDSFAPVVGLLRGHRATEGDRPFLKDAETLFDRDGSFDDETRQLAYSLAKAFDDLGEYETAIRYYDRANRLAAQLQKPNGMDREAHTHKLNEVIRVFDRTLLSKPFPGANPTDRPIFILGMIRSGTTLVEQIVSQHSQVKAGGELRFWIDQGPSVLLPDPYGLNAELSEFLGLEYMAALKRLAPAPQRVSDKMPLNYYFVGLIHLLFPNAPIIHCRRDPSDTCLSIYMTPHAAPPDFAYDRDDIAFAYREYRRVMEHWHDVLPEEKILDLDYESLVHDPEPNIRRLIDFCGLDWDPACLSPETNEREVDTPSKWQIRQPVYRSSVGRSRHYEPWLGALRGDTV